MIGAWLLALSSAVPFGVYDCAIDPPRWLVLRDSKAELRNLNFPDLGPDDWKFRLELVEGVGANISPVASDPLGISGNHGVMTTGENSYVLASYASKNCVLTDAGCAAVVQFVTQADGSLRFLALPSAIISLDGNKIPEAFNAIAPGKCEFKGGTK